MSGPAPLDPSLTPEEARVLAMLWDKGFAVGTETARVPPDAHGVTWTRDPDGGREMRLEFRRGTGDMRHISFPWNGPLPRTGLPDFSYAVREWKRIEALLGFPQEIAWTVRKKEWSVVRVRPIRTMTPGIYHQQKLLDALLPSSPFLYEKTEVTELSPRPTPVTLSLLQRLYRDGGPVQTAYEELGLQYNGNFPFVLVGNDLLVDRDREMDTLFPSLHPGRMSILRLTGLPRTIRNMRVTRGLDPAAHTETVRERLTMHTASINRQLPLFEAIEQIERIYPTLILTDICAAKVMTTLRRTLGDTPVSLSALLIADLHNTNGLTTLKEALTDPPMPIPPTGLVGNTLELADLSPFYALPFTQTSNWDISRWWNGLSAERRADIEPALRAAQAWTRLREQGRWLLVAAIHALRDIVLLRAAKADLDRSLSWYVTLDEYLDGTVFAERARIRRNARASLDTLVLPSRLTNRAQSKQVIPVPVGVAPGTATGKIVTLETLAEASGPIILHVRTPSPDLTRHLARAGGILAEHGSMLSHLAIIARERRVPMIVGVTLGKDLQAGDVVDMNGGTGEMRVLKREM